MLRPCGGESAEQVGFEESDAIGEAEASRMALRNGESGRRNIERAEFCGRKFFGESDSDAAGAGANVGDEQSLAGHILREFGEEIAQRKAVQRDFNEVFGFRAGNQYIRRDCKFEPPE